MSTLAGNPNYQVTIVQHPTYTSTSGVAIVAYMPDKFMFDASSTYEAPFAQGLLGSGALANGAALFGYKLITPALTAAVWTGSSSSELSLSLEFFAETNARLDVLANVVALLKLVTPNVDTTSGLITSPGPTLSVASALNAAVSGVNSIKSIVNTSITNDISNIVVGALSSAAKIVKNLAIPTTMNNANSSVIASSSSSAANFKSTNATSLGATNIWKQNINNGISIKIGNYAYFDSVVITKVQQTYSSILDGAGTPTHAVVEVSFKPLFLVTQDDIDNIFL